MRTCYLMCCIDFSDCLFVFSEASTCFHRLPMHACLLRQNWAVLVAGDKHSGVCKPQLFIHYTQVTSSCIYNHRCNHLLRWSSIRTATVTLVLITFSIHWYSSYSFMQPRFMEFRQRSRGTQLPSKWGTSGVWLECIWVWTKQIWSRFLTSVVVITTYVALSCFENGQHKKHLVPSLGKQ